MIVTGKSLSRRTVLKGMGAAIGLPFLDAMTPAFARAAAPGPVRLAWFYLPNGIDMRNWTPAAEGPLGTLPGILSPFEPLKDDLLVLSNLTTHWGRPLGRRGRSRPRARLATTGAGLQDRRRRSGSDFRRSDRRGDRQADAAAVARDRARRSAGRPATATAATRAHLQPVVEERNAAAAADFRSARPVRTALRIRRAEPAAARESGSRCARASSTKCSATPTA